MNFSDWITIVSILAALLIAVFKFDEWEVIRLRRIEKHLFCPIFFLFLSGISSFFKSNPHPNWLDYFWSDSGLQSGVWSVIWMALFFLCTIIGWRRFTNKKPPYELINKYIDYLENYEPSRFSSLFRKYERYFFNSLDDDVWLHYELILINKKWWVVAPNYFKELVFKYPIRFYKMNIEVLKTLIISQLSDIPNSQLTNELKAQWNGVILSKNTPILNIYFSTKSSIEIVENGNVLVDSIKGIANEYFNSIEFLNNDKQNFHLKPSINSSNQTAPKLLIPFFYIEFINCYWHQVISTNAQVRSSKFYLPWAESLLTIAPKIDSNNNNLQLSNLSVVAVEKMLSNIGDWIDLLKEKEQDSSDLEWAAQNFVTLNHLILSKIQDKFMDKVSEIWFVEKMTEYFYGLIVCKDVYQRNFNPDLNQNSFDNSTIRKAFKELTTDSYCSDSEKEKYGYKWLKNILDLN